MSYTQTFKGTLEFADAHCLELALDAFVQREDSIIDLDHLVRDGLELAIDVECSAPASMYEATLVAIDALAEHALAGCVDSTFHLDGVSHDRSSSGELAHARPDDPPPHLRWELYFAARCGDAGRLRELAGAGVSLAQSFPSNNGSSPLHLAAAAGSIEAIDLLLAAGVPADVAQGTEGMTPLFATERVDAALRLMDAGADCYRRYGDTSLMEYAAMRGRGGIVRALLERGVRVPEDARRSIAKALARHGNLQALIATVAKDPLVVVELREPEVMEAAIESKDQVLVDYLLEHGARLPDDLLERAVVVGAKALLETALRHPEALARCGPSSRVEDAMCVAARYGRLEAMQLLHAHGVPLVPEAPGETTPLHQAAASFERDAEACIEWLLERGVPVDVRDASSNTPLRDAFVMSRLSQMALLVRRGADESEIDPSALAPEDVDAYYALRDRSR